MHILCSLRTEAVPLCPCARADPGVSAFLSQHGDIHYRMFLAIAFRVLTLATSATFMEYSGAENDAPMATFGFLSGKPVISGGLLVIQMSEIHQEKHPCISPSFIIGPRWCHQMNDGTIGRTIIQRSVDLWTNITHSSLISQKHIPLASQILHAKLKI